jgi:hypothetical protein
MNLFIQRLNCLYRIFVYVRDGSIDVMRKLGVGLDSLDVDIVGLLRTDVEYDGFTKFNTALMFC